MMVLSLLFCTIQAVVFTMLSSIYLEEVTAHDIEVRWRLNIKEDSTWIPMLFMPGRCADHHAEHHRPRHCAGVTARSAMEAIARQPEAAGDVRSTLVIALALMEALTIWPADCLHAVGQNRLIKPCKLICPRWF